MNDYLLVGLYVLATCFVGFLAVYSFYKDNLLLAVVFLLVFVLLVVHLFFGSKLERMANDLMSRYV